MRAKRRQSLPRVKSMKLSLSKLDRHQRESPAMSQVAPGSRAGRLRWRMGIPWNPVWQGGGDYHRLVRGGDTDYC